MSNPIGPETYCKNNVKKKNKIFMVGKELRTIENNLLKRETNG